VDLLGNIEGMKAFLYKLKKAQRELSRKKKGGDGLHNAMEKLNIKGLSVPI
jgi:hypothetical protein